GAVSDLGIVDSDGEIGEATLLASGLELPETRTVRTPNGGRHRYYALDPARGKVGKCLGFLNKVDWLAEGAYALAPPSRVYRDDGSIGTYAVENPGVPVAAAPEWCYAVTKRPDQVADE